MTVDSISNLLTVLRNALMIKKSLVSVPYTKINYKIAKILENQGFIHCATFIDENSSAEYTSSHDDQSNENSLQTINKEINSGKKKYLSKYIVIALKYVGREKKSIIHTLKRISKPSLRYYLPNPIPQSLGGLGIFILSTNLGIMTDKEARIKKVGGEIVAEIW